MPDTANKPEALGASYSQADWDEVSDNPEMTDAELAQLRPIHDVPELHALLPKRGRGRPRQGDAKVNFTMRIDPTLLDAYKATGEGWQVRMQEALRIAFPMVEDAMPAPVPEQDGVSPRMPDKRSA